MLCRRAVKTHAPRRRRDGRPALSWLATVAAAAALGLVLYIASTSLPYLANSPTADPRFGAYNQCLLGALAAPRIGFAVAKDGHHVAGFDGAHVVECGLSDGGALIERATSLSGVASASFDGQGDLWLATAQPSDGGERLWTWPVDAGLVSKDFAPIAVAGATRGAVAMDAAGRIVSFGPDGEVFGAAQLPAPPIGFSELAVDAQGTVVAVVAGRALFAYRLPKLEPVRAEAPCEVEYLWWTASPSQALVSCGPNQSFALAIQIESGEREAAPHKDRVRSTYIPGLNVYAQACEHLPCTAPAP
jgi:hypothetical protein